MPSTAQSISEAFGALLSHATDGPLERGVKLAASGAVHIVSCDAQMVSARVQGTSRYRVELRNVGSGRWSCNCMAAADGSFCKHCVAVACLLGSGPSDEEQIDVALDVDPVESYVRSLDKDALARLLLSIADNDDRVRQRLVGEAAAHTSETIDVREWKKKLTVAFRGRGGFIEWRHAADWAAGVHDALDVLWSFLGAGHAAEVAVLAEHAHLRNESAVNRVDDSGGEITNIMGAIAEVHLAAAEAGAYTAKKLGKRLAELELKSELDTFHRSATTYAEVLGADGLDAYGAVVEKAFEARPPSESRWGPGFRLRSARVAHALATGDVDRLVEISFEDHVTLSDIIELVDLLIEHDRFEEAMEWADRGLDDFPRALDRGSLRQRKADLIMRTEGGAEAVEQMYWDDFRSEPSARSVVVLLDSAVDRPDAQSRVLDWLGEFVASFHAEPDDYEPFHTVGQSTARVGSVGASPSMAGNHTPVVATIDVFLELDELDRAWDVAMSHGAARNQWAELTRRRRVEHPRDAIDWAFVQANIEIDRKERKHYKRAVRILQDEERLLLDGGDEAGKHTAYFTERVTALVAKYPNRPSFLAEFKKVGWTT